MHSKLKFNWKLLSRKKTDSKLSPHVGVYVCNVCIYNFVCHTLVGHFFHLSLSCSLRLIPNWEGKTWSPKAALNHPLFNASMISYLVPTTGGGGGGGGGINIPELPILPFPTGKH